MYASFIGMQFSQAVCICMSQVAVMKRVQVIYNENVSENVKNSNTHTYTHTYNNKHHVFRTP